LLALSMELVGSCCMSLRLQAYTYTAAPSNTATPATTDATIGVTGADDDDDDDDDDADGCCSSGSGKGGAEGWFSCDALDGVGPADGASFDGSGGGSGGGSCGSGGIPADSIDLPLRKAVRETMGVVVCWT
jgi:hypothetical protein